MRRLFVLGVAAAVVTVAVGLVVGIAQLLDHSTDGSGGERAVPVASSPDAGDSTTRASRKRTAEGRVEDKGAQGGSKQDEGRDRLAKPEGPCDDGDVLVTPTIAEAYAGSPVRIVLEVTTVKADACYWQVSPESVFVNIEREDGTIWSSQDCPSAVPTHNVVPRRERAAKVAMWWDGKESDEGCPSWTEWVQESGLFTAVAAARGSVNPVATGFYLSDPVAATVTVTPTPTPTRTTAQSPAQSPARAPAREPEDRKRR